MSADHEPQAQTDATLPPSTADLEWDRKAERRVLWKVDLLLMPVLTFSYGLQFVR